MEISKNMNVRVLGVGKVGMSVVQAFAQSGFQVCGVDIDQANLDMGLERTKTNLQYLVGKNKISAQEQEAILSRINLTTDFAAIADADTVIEAVFEDMM